MQDTPVRKPAAALGLTTGAAADPLPDLMRRARAAMATFAAEIDREGQPRIDEAVTALAWSIYKPETAKRYAELAVEITGIGDVDEQDHQEPAQDLRHAARPAAREVHRYHRGTARTGPRQMGQARRRRRSDHALDQPAGDAGQQGDDGDQGRQRDRHRAAAERVGRDRTGRRRDARRTRPHRPPRRSRADPARSCHTRADDAADGDVRSRRRDRQPGERQGGLQVRQAGAGRRARQRACDHRFNGRSRFRPPT